MLLKKYKETIAAIDEELLGNIYEEGEIYLDLKSYRSFYEGKQASEQEIIEALKEMKLKNGSANLIGKPAIIAIENGFADKENIKYIKGVAILQIYWV